MKLLTTLLAAALLAGCAGSGFQTGGQTERMGSAPDADPLYNRADSRPYYGA